MKKFLLGTVAIFALGAAPAFGADLSRPVYKAPPPVAAPLYNWTGFYIGANIGGAWAGSGNIDSGGHFMGGGQVGADWQFGPNWVLGAEGQIDGLTNGDNNGTAFPVLGVVTRKDNVLGSVTGRIGWTWGPGLLYVKGGYAFTDTTLGTTIAGVPVAFAVSGNNKNGFTVGGGLEYLFAPNWSAKAEYQYYNFGNTTFVPPSPAGLAGTTFHNDEHTVKVGVNYRFGWQ